MVRQHSWQHSKIISIHDSVQALYVDWKAFSVSGQRACLGHYGTACRFHASYSLDLHSN